MSISLNGDDLVKRLARITYQANIPYCDLAERLIKEFKEEVCLVKDVSVFQHLFRLLAAGTRLCS